MFKIVKYVLAWLGTGAILVFATFAIGSLFVGVPMQELFAMSWNSGELILGFLFWGISLKLCWEIYKKG